MIGAIQDEHRGCNIHRIARALVHDHIVHGLATAYGEGFVDHRFERDVLAAAALLVWRSGRHPHGVGIREPKPPGLGLALIFAATVAIISMITAWAQTRFGSTGGALVIALGGTADIDAAIASVGSLPPETLPRDLAALAIASPILYNTFTKGLALLVIARSRRALPAAVALGVTSLVLLVPILTALCGARG